MTLRCACSGMCFVWIGHSGTSFLSLGNSKCYGSVTTVTTRGASEPYLLLGSHIHHSTIQPRAAICRRAEPATTALGPPAALPARDFPTTVSGRRAVAGSPLKNIE